MIQGYTGPNSDIPVPGVFQQVTDFIESEAEATEDTVYIIEIGGNDYYFNPELEPNKVVLRIIASMEELHQKVFFHFFLFFENQIK